MTRRQLFVIVEAGAATAALAGCAVLSGGASHPVLPAGDQVVAGTEVRIPLSALAHSRAGDVTEIKPGHGLPDLLLLTPPQGETWHVVTAHCTHKGCVVAWDGTATEWHCPCHGSKFGADGHVVAGPAERPLGTPPARVDGNSLVIDCAGLGAAT